MRLPNGEEAYVAREKITQYLLNRNHPDGVSKALFFSGFGFDVERWRVLADALRILGATHDVVEISEIEWGIEYVVEGELETPDGRNPRIRTVWIVRRGSDTPRLVTAYPMRRRDDAQRT